MQDTSQLLLVSVHEGQPAEKVDVIMADNQAYGFNHSPVKDQLTSPTVEESHNFHQQSPKDYDYVPHYF